LIPLNNTLLREKGIWIKERVNDMGFRNIILESDGKIYVITINRPKALNALNMEVVAELIEAIDCIDRDKNSRALIITGGKQNFAAGADISAMVELVPEYAREFSFKDLFNEIENLPIPVIAAIAGYALGGGLELALACDLRICSRDAKLGLPEIKLGIFPGAGGTQRLPKLIGATRAKEMIYFGKTIDAETAFKYGLCNRIVDEDPVAGAMEMAIKLTQGPPIALRSAKHVINYGLNADTRTGIEFEAVAWADLFSTLDQKEGMKAFLEKRNPNFQGR